MKYAIKKDYLPICKTSPRRRAGIFLDGKVRFIVAHDTGNLNSTAQGNVNHYKNTYNKESASAHLFVDDKEIIECIPAFEKPEKAWHVLYNVIKDNKMYGDDANDVAIGVELCFFTDKNRSNEAYKRYVWLLAYLCYYHKLNPQKDIVGHETLDPKNKTDPSNGLKYSGHTFKDLIADVQKEYDNLCGDVELENALNILSTKKIEGDVIINTHDYWRNAIKNKEVNTEWLRALIIKTAKYLSKV